VELLKTKAKGFTLLELIITLSLTVLVLGVVYTFFFSNSKTLSTTEINSDLQLEAEAIQKDLLMYGTQAEGISKINGVELITTKDMEYSSISASDGKLDVTEIKLKVGADYFTFLYNEINNTLTIRKVNEEDREVIDSKLNLPKELSNNVSEFKVRPLDYRMNPTGNFKDALGLEISLVLNKKKGYSDVTIPVSVIVKLRNKTNI
jgi:prepilin-type N-terminal cleavage/methylation domain-containing protein